MLYIPHFLGIMYDTYRAEIHVNQIVLTPLTNFQECIFLHSIVHQLLCVCNEAPIDLNPCVLVPITLWARVLCMVLLNPYRVHDTSTETFLLDFCRTPEVPHYISSRTQHGSEKLVRPPFLCLA